MKYLNTVIKKLIYIFKVYFVLIILILICILRLYTYKVPESKILNYKTTVLLTNPVIIDNGVINLHTSTYKIKTRKYYDYKLGYIYNIYGDKYFNTIYANNITEYGKSPLFSLFKIKQNLINSLSTVLMEPYYSLVLGMLYGVPPNYSEDFTNMLINTGVIHVIVVSGYNISILFLFVSKTFFYVSIKKRMFIASVVSIFYALLTGFEPPIIRALIFGIIVSFAKSFGGKVSILYALFVTALIMIIVSPSTLYLVSFQLSFMACLGLILFSNDLSYFADKIFLIKKMPLVLKEAFITSICAQVLVFPILLYYFNGMSLLGVFTNTLVLWVVPYIMLLGFIFSLISLLVPVHYFGFIFSLILYLPLMYFVDVLNFMSKFSKFSIFLSLSLNQVFLLYFAILLLFFIYKKFKPKSEEAR